MLFLLASFLANFLGKVPASVVPVSQNPLELAAPLDASSVPCHQVFDSVVSLFHAAVVAKRRAS